MAASDLVTLAEVKEHLQIPTAETDQDAVIGSLITRVSAAITAHCDRQFIAETGATHRVRVQADRFVRGAYLVDLAPWDLRTLTSASLHPETTSPQVLTRDYDFSLEPYEKPDGVYDRLRIHGATQILTSTVAQRFGYAYLDLVGDWGFAAVPADVKEAAILAVSMYLRAEVQAFGSGLQPNSFGDGVNEPHALPPGVRGLLARYVRSMLA